MEDDNALWKSLGLVAFSAYALGTTAELTGLPGPVFLPTLMGALIGSVFAALNRYYNVRVWRAPSTRLNVVITGGSKGLGKALAREFLRCGDRVVILARRQHDLDEAVRVLQVEAGPDVELHGLVGDVACPDSMRGCAEEISRIVGTVDVWVNNAGYSGSFKLFADSTPEQISQVVRTNLQGGLLCAKHALRLMQHQPLGGHLFLMDGAGSDGFATPQYAAYGATKCALPQLAQTLREEVQGHPIGVHVLSPGMMITELLLEGATLANKQVFNILCEHPETVAAFLVPRMRSLVARGDPASYTRYLTPTMAVYRFLTAPSRVGKFFDGEGNPTYLAEHERIVGRHARRTARMADHARRRTGGLGVAYSLALTLSVLVMVADAAKVAAGQ